MKYKPSKLNLGALQKRILVFLLNSRSLRITARPKSYKELKMTSGQFRKSISALLFECILEQIRPGEFGLHPKRAYTKAQLLELSISA